MNHALHLAPVEAFPPARRTVPQMLRRQAERHGERPLFICGGERWTFADARDAAARHAGILLAAGVARGDRVALLCGNRAELLRLILGCAWAGAVSVPLNAAVRGFALQHMLSNSGARLLAIEAALLPALATIDLEELALERIWIIGGAEAQERPLRAATGREVVIEALPATGGEVPDADPGPGDLFTILYTSGTTGPSKGVCCPHAQYFWWGAYTGWQLGVGEGDVLHTPLPLFHTNALNCFFQALLHGATQVVEPRFSASGFWPALAQSRATVTYLLGAMVPMLLSRPPHPAEREHRVRVALAPGVPAGFHAPFTSRTGVVLLDGFGSTESNLIIASRQGDAKPGYMGRLVPGFSARVVDDADNDVADGEAGELIVRAEEPFALASGYFAMPDQTVAAWRNLWLHTGDRVVREADGYYRFVDRMKDAIRRRGENISSFEVEQVLASHPAVALAAVFPVASELAEDEVMAAIVLKDGARAGEEELLRHCENKMPYFAVPRFIELMDALPRTENGKVQKFKLRERGRTTATWDREAAGVRLKR
ncbi:MAG: ATP-dependent acyl-CoA ligase [Bradyrhizobiaceae bacterium]|nr:ATP-dependent acyl-CoA ligase [Bradyrhizobiaceae bacterium]